MYWIGVDYGGIGFLFFGDWVDFQYIGIFQFVWCGWVELVIMYVIVGGVVIDQV